MGPLGGTRDGQSDLTARRVDCGATTAVSSNPALVELNAGDVSLPCMPRVSTDAGHVRGCPDPTVAVGLGDFIIKVKSDREM